MHSAAVTSIATGEATGIAPKANLHFFAKWRNENEPNWWNDLIDAFKQILQYNQTCLENNNIKDQIRVVSISGPIFWWEYAKNLVNELENSWVLVISWDNFSHDFWYLGKKDPMWNPDTFDNYKYCFWNSNALFVNSWDRTVADSRDKSAYRYDSDASASWAIPVVASYYTLACQADPSMTPEKFKNLARATAHKMDSGIEWVGTIEVINIKNLIDTIIKWENK